MLQVARLAPRLLSEASDLVREFILGETSEDGGFKNREGKPDLYYTVFGIESLMALRADVPAAPLERYLRSFGDGDGLDLVYLACLARCWADLPGVEMPAAHRQTLLARMESFRSRDGGFHGNARSETGTVYGCFIALGAYQDLRVELPHPEGVLDCLRGLETADGAWANGRAIQVGSTPATAAAVTLLRNLGRSAPPGVGEWLEARCHKEGGFHAMPSAPIPDLLSTATALHALAGLERSFERIKEPCLDFIDTLWTNRGSFHGSWTDGQLDCEYTYYGLLALGHLSL
jgi:prenyltransferase beta subunit